MRSGLGTSERNAGQRERLSASDIGTPSHVSARDAWYCRLAASLTSAGSLLSNRAARRNESCTCSGAGSPLSVCNSTRVDDAAATLALMRAAATSSPLRCLSQRLSLHSLYSACARRMALRSNTGTTPKLHVPVNMELAARHQALGCYASVIRAHSTWWVTLKVDHAHASTRMRRDVHQHLFVKVCVPLDWRRDTLRLL